MILINTHILNFIKINFILKKIIINFLPFDFPIVAASNKITILILFLYLINNYTVILYFRIE